MFSLPHTNCISTFKELTWMIALAAILMAALVQDALAFHPQRVANEHGKQARATEMLAVINVPTRPDFDALSRLGARPWSCRPGLGRGIWLISEQQLVEAEALGLRCQVTVQSVQDLITAEQRSREQSRRAGDWFSDFRTYAEVVSKVDSLATEYDQICEKITVGVTHEGREIVGLVINPDARQDKPAVLLNGCQHAREWISVMVPMYIAEQLLVGYGSDSQITSLLDATEVVIVPIVNPDGYVHTHTTYRLWRKNRRNHGDGEYGVDLNRNWSVDWGGPESTSTNTSSDVYIGPSAFSEPETAAMRDLVLSRDNIVAQIDFHNYSMLILQPWGHTNTLPADYVAIDTLGERMSNAIYGVHQERYPHGSGSSLIYLASGTCEDWHYSQGIFGYTIELRPSSNPPGFLLPADEIVPTGQENFQAVLEMMEFATEPAQILFPEGKPVLVEQGQTVELVFSIHPGAGPGIDPSTVEVMAREQGNSSFSSQTITYLGDQTYRCTFSPSSCQRSIEYYISGETAKGIVITSPEEAPSQWYSFGVGDAFFVENLDTDPGWERDGQWGYGQCSGSGGQYGDPDPTTGNTGNNVFGYNLNGDYANNLPERYLTTDPIDCSAAAGTELRFYRWLNVEQPAYDHASIQVSADGSPWSTVWTNSSEITDVQWTEQRIDLSAYADGQPSVQLRWVMGTTDSAWRYSGWNIDDITLWSQASPGPALGSADLNCDGQVGIEDISIFLINFDNCFGESACPGDINDDGAVNTADFSYILIQFGS